MNTPPDFVREKHRICEYYMGCGPKVKFILALSYPCLIFIVRIYTDRMNVIPLASITGQLHIRIP